MAELAPFIHDDKNGLDYILVGDYYVPALLPDDEETRPIGRFGEMRKRFLMDYHHGVYSAFLMNGTLWTHLADVNERAEECMDVLVDKMASIEGVTERLKEADQMAWVRAMNSIHYRAEEIVRAEIIYTL